MLRCFLLTYFKVYRKGGSYPLDPGVDPEESWSKSSFFFLIKLLKNVGDYWSFFVGWLFCNFIVPSLNT